MMLTVFTPAYNRAAYLNRLYDSLIRQESKDFEWLIVDDGSTDNTSQTVQSFMEQRKLEIRYVRKENGGKHTAYNEALQHARGAWFLCVDADDQLAENAVALLTRAIKTVSAGTAIAAYKTDMDGKRLSDPFPAGVDTCKISDLALRLGCRGEFTFVFPTDIARKYPFPVFPGEKFVGESVVYDRLERECPVHLLGEVITECEYLGDGYSMNFGALMGRNPTGFCLYFLQRIDLAPTFAAALTHAGKYWCFRWISGSRQLRYDGPRKGVCALGWPVGVVFRLYYKLLRGF